MFTFCCALTLGQYHRVTDVLCARGDHRPHWTRHCNCHAVKKLCQNPGDPDSRLDFHCSLPCVHVQTSEKDDEEITNKVVNGERRGSCGRHVDQARSRVTPEVHRACCSRVSRGRRDLSKVRLECCFRDERKEEQLWNMRSMASEIKPATS